MTRHLVFAIPGDLNARTGGYAYDRRMIIEMRRLGWEVEVAALPAGFPDPDKGDLDRTARLLADLPDGSLVLTDGLAFGAMPDIAEREAARLRFAALVHHPLALEGGASLEQRVEVADRECRALAVARAVVVTSRSTGRTLAQDYAVPAERIFVAPPGTDRRERARGTEPVPTILSVGTLVPRKGHDVFIAALGQIRDLPWHCRIIGDAERDRATVDRLAELAAEAGVSDRIAFPGAIDDVESEFARADIFALATRHEGYGMVFAEALAHGLPVVGTRVGAVPDVVPGPAGILVPPDDPVAMADALRRLLVDTQARRRMAEASFRAGQALPDWCASAAILAEAMERVSR